MATEYEKLLYNSSVRDELGNESARCVVVMYFMRQVLMLMKDRNMLLQDATEYVTGTLRSDVMSQVKQAVQHLSFVNDDGKLDDDLFG